MMNESILLQNLQNNFSIRDGFFLIVHSSYKSLGPVEGGPRTVVKALMKSVGLPNMGTLMMPTFTRPEKVINLDKAKCNTGIIPETFRQMDGCIRTIDATHSVSIMGEYSDIIFRAHLFSEPLGINSPFHIAALKKANVLHIGCDLASSSLLHVAESIAKLPYLSIPYNNNYKQKMDIIFNDGKIIVEKKVTEFPGCSMGFVKIQDMLIEEGIIRRGKLADADCIIYNALEVLQRVVEILYKEPDALLCDFDDCEVCKLRRIKLRKK